MEQEDGQPHHTFTVELVWDANHEATALAGGACHCEAPPLQIGERAGWLPQHHFVLAVAGAFMEALLDVSRRADVEILGYVSVAKLHVSDEGRLPPQLTLTPCIVVGTAADAAKVADFTAQAADECALCRLLRDALTIHPSIRVIDEDAESPA